MIGIRMTRRTIISMRTLRTMKTKKNMSKKRSRQNKKKKDNQKNNHHNILEKLQAMHQAFANELSIETGEAFAAHWQILVDTCENLAAKNKASAADHAVICGTGELLSTALACQILNEHGVKPHWLDARQILKLNEEATEGDRKQYLSAICHYQADCS